MPVKNIIKSFFPTITCRYQAFDRLICMKESYLHSSGWIESLRRGYPCYPNGDPIPWMNFASISIIRQRLSKDMNVFEYGSGYSTLFYAKLAKSVFSVEHDDDWRTKIGPSLPTNATIVHVALDTNGCYCRSIEHVVNPPSVIIVDGRDRVNCLKRSVDGMAGEAVIVLDDSHRDRYGPGIAYAREHGLSVLDIEGMKPGGLEMNQTSFIYRPGNCLGI